MECYLCHDLYLWTHPVNFKGQNIQICGECEQHYYCIRTCDVCKEDKETLSKIVDYRDIHVCLECDTTCIEDGCREQTEITINGDRICEAHLDKYYGLFWRYCPLFEPINLDKIEWETEFSGTWRDYVNSRRCYWKEWHVEKLWTDVDS